MNKSLSKRNFFILSTIFISIIIIFIFTREHISGGVDCLFHYARVDALAENIKHGILLPSIDTNNSGGMGYLINIFYPYLFIYPMAFLRILSVPVFYSFFIMFIIYYCLGFGLTYYFLKKYYNEDFAICFCSGYFINVILIYFNLLLYSFYPMLIGAFFLPLVFFGIDVLFNHKNMTMLILGITFTLNNNLWVFIIGIISILYYMIFNLKTFFKKENLKLLTICAIKCIILNSFFLIPFIYHYFNESIIFNTNTDIMLKGRETSYWVSMSSPKHLIYFLCFSILSILLSINLKMPFIADIGIAIIILAFNCCNLHFGGKFAFSHRLIILACLLFSKGLYLIIKDNHLKKIELINIINFVLLICLIGKISINDSAIMSNAEIIPEKYVYYDYRSLKHIINVKDIKQKGNYFMFFTGEYLPSNLPVEFYNHIGTWETEEGENYITNLKEDLLSNLDNYSISREHNKTTLTFENSEKTNVTVPLIYYINYKAYYNGKEVPVINNNGFVSIENIKGGTLLIEYKIDFIQIIAFIISVSYLSYVIVLYIKKNRMLKKPF